MGVFDSTKSEALDVLLAAPGPSVVPEPEYVDHEGGAIDASVGVEVAHALLAFTNRQHMDQARITDLQRLDPRLPKPTEAAPQYLELSLSILPPVATPKVAPKRLSTGEVALEIGDCQELLCKRSRRAEIACSGRRENPDLAMLLTQLRGRARRAKRRVY